MLPYALASETLVRSWDPPLNPSFLLIIFKATGFNVLLAHGGDVLSKTFRSMTRFEALLGFDGSVHCRVIGVRLLAI